MVVAALLAPWPIVLAHEAPITGTVKAVDTAARTVTLDAVVEGTRVEVAIHVGPDTRVVRLTRAAQALFRFVERPATLADIRPGATVSVTTDHEGEREIARLVRILHEN
jgi:hypothetical protein